MTGKRRVGLEVEGTVQGVGFRPFVYRLALRFGLSGWVRNTGRGVMVEAEGSGELLERFARAVREEAPPLAAISAVREKPLPLAGGSERFARAVREEAPPLAAISAVREKPLPLAGGSGFAILESDHGNRGGEIPPDCGVCDDCLAELFDPGDRRYLYPFINCTNCGPRYSIITSLPYDRPATTMAPFAMCDDCLAEYHDPLDRRFHAQPNACPACGPRLVLRDRSGALLSGEPVAEAVRALAQGMIVAVKGVGGYHLAADACNGEVVGRLRQRKKRDEKPFALLAADLGAVRRFARCSEREERLLSGLERPIVLLRKLPENPISRLVAPDNGWFGVMLPGNPLQHLLLRGGAGPLVLTSGNRSDEPIASLDAEALERLSGIADLFLCHDREIHARSDDSVLRLFGGKPLFLRRSRGYAPRAVPLPAPQESVVAVGAELKGAVCLSRGAQGFLSQHLGDLGNAATLDFLERTVGQLGRLLEVAPKAVAHDLHPDYPSTRFAERLKLPKVGVQHHHAHMASCMAENGLKGEVIGVVLDGSGYGDDGAVWGGEFLLGGYGGFKRAGHFGYLRMPGGDAAVREPYRMAISALYRLYGADLFEKPLPFLSAVGDEERALLLKMLERGINSPFTSSCGRLFDAVAALVGVRNRISYEGQAAIELEALAERGGRSRTYPYLVQEADGHIIDFTPTIAAICDDLARSRERAEIARAFHRTVAQALLELCLRIREESGTARVVLSGGVFQNRLLTEEAALLLTDAAFEVHCHRLVPPNDGGIALGQAVVAGHLL